MEYQDLVLWVLEEAEVCSWARLGAMSEERWQRALSYMPIKNPDVPADLLDRSKLGPGHVDGAGGGAPLPAHRLTRNQL